MSRARPLPVIISAQKKFDRDLSDTRLLGGGSGFIALTCAYDGIPYRGLLFQENATFASKAVEAFGFDPRAILNACEIADETKEIAIPTLPTTRQISVITEDIVLSDSGSCTASPSALRDGKPFSDEPAPKTPQKPSAAFSQPLVSAAQVPIVGDEEFDPDILGSDESDDEYDTLEEEQGEENVEADVDMFDLTNSSDIPGQSTPARSRKSDYKRADISQKKEEALDGDAAQATPRGRIYRRNKSVQASPSTSNAENPITPAAPAPLRKPQPRKKTGSEVPKVNPITASEAPARLNGSTEAVSSQLLGTSEPEIPLRTKPVRQIRPTAKMVASRIDLSLYTEPATQQASKRRSKSVAHVTETVNGDAAEPVVKRGRGRPRKNPIVTNGNEVAAKAATPGPLNRPTETEVPLRTNNIPAIRQKTARQPSVAARAIVAASAPHSQGPPYDSADEEDELGPPGEEQNAVHVFDHGDIPDPPNFTTDCYVWAKDAWSPYWPGRYIRMVSATHAHIVWCGHKSHSTIPTTYIEPFVENIGKRLIGKRKEKKYSRGFIDAVRACNVDLSVIPEMKKLNGPVRKALIDAGYDFAPKPEVTVKRRSRSSKFY